MSHAKSDAPPLNWIAAQKETPTTTEQLESQEEQENMTENNIKPMLSLGQATGLLERLYNLFTSEIRPLPSYDDQNFYVSSSNGNEYVLKISNTIHSENPTVIEIQTCAMSYLNMNGFPTQNIIPTNAGQLWGLQELDCGFGLQKYLVRLLTYLPGITISKAALTPQLLYEVGKMAARIDKALQTMKHPNISDLDRNSLVWKLSNLPLLEQYLFVLKGDPLQEVVKSVIELFKSSVSPKYPSIRKSIIHGDFNDLNILVQPDSNGSHKISAVLDFGDMNNAFYIHELAITIAHMMSVHANPIEVGGAVLAGWESELPLTETERDCLYVLVLSRFCLIMCNARHCLLSQPENEYLIMWSKKMTHALQDFWKLSRVHVERAWFHGTVQ